MATPKEKPAKRPPKTIKEKKFAKALIATGGDKVAAVKEAGYNVTSDVSARAIASQKLQKLTIVDMMDSTPGLTAVDRLKCLAEGLYSTKQIGLKVIPGKDQPDASDEQMDYGEVPDYATRYKYLELTFKLDGSLKNQEQPGIHFHAHVGTEQSDYAL